MNHSPRHVLPASGRAWGALCLALLNLATAGYTIWFYAVPTTLLSATAAYLAIGELRALLRSKELRRGRLLCGTALLLALPLLPFTLYINFGSLLGW